MRPMMVWAHDLGPPRAVLSTFPQRWPIQFCAIEGEKWCHVRNRPSGTNSPLYSTGGSGAANDGPAPRFTMYSEQPSQ